jgi:hypothetical protein
MSPKTLSLLLLFSSLAVPCISEAQVCEGTPIYDACIAAIGRAGGPTAIVRDIFRTPDGADARRLRFGRYLRGVVAGGGTTTDPTMYTAYVTRPVPTPEIIGEHVNALDFMWGQHARQFDDGSFVPDGVGPGSPIPGHNCDLDDNCGYAPWRGTIFDLLGDANRVAVFPVTDHTTDSCLEAFEYSVYLTSNPDAMSIAPEGTPDPMRWNKAVLIRAFTEGWTRGGEDPAMVSPRGNYIADSPTLVWALPCGVTFRYASIIGGNYGSPGLECRFNSYENELDAVAGLNEDNTTVCPDMDGDGFRDRACGGNDCNDTDRTVNPGAVETCSTTRDLDCDGRVNTCPTNTTCFNGLCAPACVEGGCATGFTCVTAAAGASACLPTPCAASTCPAGQVCGPAGCQDPCTGARCPTGQVCRGGACVDPCAGVLCPTRQHCEAGRCLPNCPCVACPSGRTCNERTGRCDAEGCGALMCSGTSLLDCTGPAPRCLARCEGVTCPLGSRCDESSSRCVADRCAGISCPGDAVCTNGECVRPPRPDAAVMDVARDAASDISPTSDMPAPPSDIVTPTVDVLVTMDVQRPADTAADVNLVVDNPQSGGCGCSTSNARNGVWSLYAALLLLAVSRRSRR